MFANPLKFREFIFKTACLCFTATNAVSIVEKNVANTLTFKEYSYIFGDDDNNNN